jgi:hypothetical protein
VSTLQPTAELVKLRRTAANAKTTASAVCTND